MQEAFVMSIQRNHINSFIFKYKTEDPLLRATSTKKEHIVDFNSYWINLDLNFNEYTSQISSNMYSVNNNEELIIKL
ncbi:hypothetical protein V1477_011661 [Vespula maculifrons]|uniref:Uncharacterized protein n=1 Tax=Vespula maculifrons TaxID=7453 RepID=A0ABD2BZT5_VESMC